MNLLVFGYCLAAFLFAYSYYVDSHSAKGDSMLTGIIMTAGFISLLGTVTAHLLYSGNDRIASLSFKFCLLCVSLNVLALFRYAMAIPYFNSRKVINAFSWILFAASVVLVFGYVGAVHWHAETGFTFIDRLVSGPVGGLSLFLLVYVVGVPAMAVLRLLVRAFSMSSKIYRQRVLLVAFALCAGFGVSYGLFRLSELYFWSWTLVPFGFAVVVVLVRQASTLNTLFDRSSVVSALVSFLFLDLFVTGVTAVIVTALNGAISLRVLAGASFVVVSVLMLAFRAFVATRLRKYIRTGSEYAEELETGLDGLDFTSGGEKVIQDTIALLDKYVECSSVDIMISDDKGKLVTAFSSINAKNEMPIENKAIDFLLNQSESIVLKTQAIANHVYADVKADLLKIFDLGRADAIILLREGHRLIGVILLGPKRRGSDYTDYDYTTLSKLYSNFFLVMYYLKNIANESVIGTVDRELEFSGQIITSIQENIDRIDHEKVDVDFITQSARKLGGDFIDFIKLAEDKYLFVMGDVSGKGLNASMSMVILKSVLRTFLTETSDFKKLVVKVNFFIKNNLPKGTFFAGVFGLMDFSSNTMYYINCGVPAMFLYTASYNNAIEIQGDGKVLGFVRDVGKYLKVKKIALNPQDIILLTTDGLVDSTNLRGERYGKDRVQRILMDNRSYPAGRMAKFLCDSLSEFVSRELEDDITVLVFKYLSK